MDAKKSLGAMQKDNLANKVFAAKKCTEHAEMRCVVCIKIYAVSNKPFLGKSFGYYGEIIEM